MLWRNLTVAFQYLTNPFYMSGTTFIIYTPSIYDLMITTPLSPLYLTTVIVCQHFTRNVPNSRTRSLLHNLDICTDRTHPANRDDVNIQVTLRTCWILIANWFPIQSMGYTILGVAFGDLVALWFRIPHRYA